MDVFFERRNRSSGGWIIATVPANARENQRTRRIGSEAQKRLWISLLRKAEVAYFRIYDLRSTYATRLSAGGVADEWVTQLLRQGDAKVLKKYSQMKLQDEARNSRETESQSELQNGFRHRRGRMKGFWHSFGTVGSKIEEWGAGGFRRSPLFSERRWSHPPGLNRRPADYEEYSPAPNSPLILYGCA